MDTFHSFGQPNNQTIVRVEHHDADGQARELEVVLNSDGHWEATYPSSSRPRIFPLHHRANRFPAIYDSEGRATKETKQEILEELLAVLDKYNFAEELSFVAGAFGADHGIQISILPV